MQLFNATVRINPVGLEIRIVSDELDSFEKCNNQFLVTTNLTIVDDEELCLLEKISWRFISEISSAIGIKNSTDPLRMALELLVFNTAILRRFGG